jgi:hypothetical protein
VKRVAALLLAALAASALAGDAEPSADRALGEALLAAGANRGELELFLKHCAETSDAEKLAAARFLVANMPDKGFVQYGWRGAKGEDVVFDALTYPNYAAAQTAMDALEKEHGSIDFVPAKFTPDLGTITAKYLIRHLDAEFAAWRAVPEAERAPFAAFLEFILPYRGGKEPLCDWITPLTARLDEMRKDLGPTAMRSDLWRKFCQDLSRRVKFDEIYYLHPTDQSFDEMEKSGKGRCGDLSTLQTYAARAFGIATACDYTPAWAHRDNNHAWTVTLDAQGRGCDKAQSHAAKVYRKTFSLQRGNLAFRMPAGRTPATRFLASKCYVDVTDQYEPTTDVTVTVDTAAAGAERFAYLCVFNGGEWVPIHWGSVEDGRVTFTRMGRNHPYLPMVHDGTKLVAVAPPLVLEKGGTVVSLPGKGASTSAALTAVDAGFVSMDTAAVTPTTHLAKGTEYALKRWDGGAWRDVGSFTADGAVRTQTDLPSDGLYWLVAKESRRLERVFTIADGRQRWW